MQITGVTMGWDLKPTLEFDGEFVLPRKSEKILYSEYYKDGEWPRDPKTGKKIPISE